MVRAATHRLARRLLWLLEWRNAPFIICVEYALLGDCLPDCSLCDPGSWFHCTRRTTRIQQSALSISMQRLWNSMASGRNFLPSSMTSMIYGKSDERDVQDKMGLRSRHANGMQIPQSCDHFMWSHTRLPGKNCAQEEFQTWAVVSRESSKSLNMAVLVPRKRDDLPT